MKVSSISLRLRADLWRILQDVVQERKEQFQANAEAALQVIVFELAAGFFGVSGLKLKALCFWVR